MKTPSITGRINDKALELLEAHPEGLHTGELKKMIQAYDQTFHPKTVNGTVWKLTEKFPTQVYKPERGLFRLLKYKK